MEDMLASSYANSDVALMVMKVRSSERRGAPTADSGEHPSAGQSQMQARGVSLEKISMKFPGWKK